ncbi:SRPBCC family protein [Mycolicibacterium sp. XJ879]
MSQHGPASAEASISINADPSAVYALITDLSTLASLAEETHAMQWSKGASAQPGAVFKGQNRNGSRTWTTTCTVTDAEPGQTFAFDVRSLAVPVAHWRYDIVAGNGGCTVTERTWDRRPGWFRKPASMATGVRDRDTANAQHIRLTLQRLKEKAESARAV